MIEGTSTVTFGTHDMAHPVSFDRKRGFECSFHFVPR
jgi:hypothetical protein